MIPLLAGWGLSESVRRLLAYVGCGLLVLALSGALWARGNHYRAQRDDARDALEKQVLAYRTAAAERKASDLVNVQRVDTESAAIDKETIHGYQARIAALRADFAERVRRATKAHSGSTAGTHLPGIPETAERADESSCEEKFPPKDALICSEQAEQLVALQEWTRRVSQIDVNGNH